jgi:hypothetical protein
MSCRRSSCSYEWLAACFMVCSVLRVVCCGVAAVVLCLGVVFMSGHGLPLQAC